jgi:hypothetical protein
MDRETYLSEIKAAYEGEIWGEAFFKTLATHDRVDEHRRRLLLLAQLEIETGNAMKELVECLGLYSEDAAPDPTPGADRAAAWSTLDWGPMMEKLASLVTPYVTRYDALAAAAAPEDSAVLERLAAHERALLIFAEHEAAQEPEHSLDAVMALLKG